MKTIAIALIATGSVLSGCVAYDTPVTRPGYYSSGQGATYYTTDGRAYSSGGTGPHYTSDGRAYYTRDGNHYYQRDRDGDGVPNRMDRRPDDPRRH